MFTIQPQSTNINAGTTVTFNSSAMSPLPSVGYQWRLNGQNIPTQTNESLTISNATAPDGGTYSVVAFDQFGATSSSNAILLVTNLALLPAANNFADRVALSNFFMGIGRTTNIGATAEIPGEPKHDGKVGGASLWLKWIAPDNGIATFTTRGSGFDTLLAVYKVNGPGFANLVPVPGGSDDDEGGFLTSTVHFNAQINVEYAIALDGSYGAQGNLTFKWDILPDPPQPDILVHPQSVTTGPGSNVVLTVTATNSSGVLSYAWTRDNSPVSGGDTATLQLLNLDASKVGGYRVEVTGNGQRVLSKIASVQIHSTPGGPNLASAAQDKFREATDPNTGPGFAGAAGGKGSPPNAGPASGFTGTQTFTTYYVGKEPGEPNHCGTAGGSSYWYTYIPPSNGVLTVDTDGTAFNNVVAVYTGPGDSFTSLVSVACSSTNAGVGKESATFSVSTASNYFVVVDGVSGAFGSAAINYNLTIPPVITTNPQSRTVFRGSNVTLNGAANGTPSPGFQWRFNSNAIGGATLTTMTRTNFDYGYEGFYDLVATNVAGAATSSVAVLYLIETNAWRWVNLSNTASNWFAATLLSAAGSNYVVQASTNLTNWLNLLTNNAPTGITNFVDTNAASFTNRFYRITN